MNKRKDYIYLEGQDVNLQEPEISFDFSRQQAEMEYCSGMAAEKDEVILTNGELERDARVASVKNGIASFEMAGTPRPARQIFFTESN